MQRDLRGCYSRDARKREGRGALRDRVFGASSLSGLGARLLCYVVQLMGPASGSSDSLLSSSPGRASAACSHVRDSYPVRGIAPPLWAFWGFEKCFLFVAPLWLLFGFFAAMLAAHWLEASSFASSSRTSSGSASRTCEASASASLGLASSSCASTSGTASTASARSSARTSV